MDDRFMMFFENDDDAVFNKKSVDSRLSEIELTLLELEVDSKSDYADPIIPMDSNATDLSNLTSSINAFTDELNSLRVNMDEKIDSMKNEIMMQVQEKIDQALSEIDDNTDRSDQIDSVKSNIQVEIMILKSELEDQIKNQTATIASDIEKIIGKASNRESRLEKVETRMQDEKDEFDEIKQALSEQKEMNAALSDSIEEQKKIFEKFEEDEVKVLSSIKSHSEKFRLVVGDLENIKPMVADLQQFVHNQEVQNQHLANDIAKVQAAEQSFESKIEDAFERWQGSFTEKVKQIENKCDESCSEKESLQPKSENSQPPSTEFQ